jgi:hypothetical protein
MFQNFSSLCNNFLGQNTGRRRRGYE